jgi:hypothetical protein
LPPTGMGTVDKAWDAVSVSFDRFCLTAGIEALGTMMERDAEQACGVRHARLPELANSSAQFADLGSKPQDLQRPRFIDGDPGLA